MKTQMQRLQSRISKRRNTISAIDSEIGLFVEAKMYVGLPQEQQYALTNLRKFSREMGHDQQLDKQLYQMLMEKERNKLAGHFRSKYPHWMATVGFGEAA